MTSLAVEHVYFTWPDHRKHKRPLGDLIVALATDPASRITALKSADSILHTALSVR